jgi:hypothetical protein
VPGHPKETKRTEETSQSEGHSIMDQESLNHPDRTKRRAYLDCLALSAAIEVYMNHPRNLGETDQEKMPPNLKVLHNQPFGETSFLLRGEADTFDPWGQVYQFKLVKRTNGMAFPLVFTTALDGTPISQYGIGENSKPRN